MRRGGRPAGCRHRAVAQAADQAARPAGRAARGEPGRNRAADRRLYPHAGPVAPDPRRAAADRGNACCRPKAPWWRRPRRSPTAILAQAEPGMPAEDRAGLARRAEEVREIGRRLVRNLTRAPFRSFAGLPEGAILVSEALRPADAALLDPSRLAGVATEEGGADGHTAVMLRALGVPAVLGAAGLAHAIAAGRHRGGRRLVRHRGAQPDSRRRWPRRAAPSPPSRASGSASAGCAACRRRRWTARRSSCRPIWNCRSSCR